MADVLSGPETGLTTDPNAADPNAPPDISYLFGVSKEVFAQPLQTDAGFSRPPGMSGTNMMLNGSSNPRGEGPTYRTIGDALQSFYGMDSQSLTQLQQALYDGGFYDKSGKRPDPSTIEWGTPDGVSYAAFEQAVIRVARTPGATLDSILSAAGSGGDTGLGGPSSAGAGSGGGTRVFPGGKVTINQTNPQTIRDVANATAQKYLGRNLNDKEAQAIVDEVRAGEDTRGRQQAALDAAGSATSIQTDEALHGTGPGAAGAGTGPPGSSPQGKLSPADRAKVAYAAGFRGQALVDAVAVSMAEGDVGEINNNPGTGDYSVGPWQINYYGKLGPERTAKYGDPQALANDPQANANAAFDLAGGGKDFSPWSTFKSGAYKKYLAAATAAAAPYLQGALAAAGVPVQGVAAGGSQGTQTDIFLQPNIGDVSTPIDPEGAATQYIQQNDLPEMQKYGAQEQIRNFAMALSSIPGDAEAVKPRGTP